MCLIPKTPNISSPSMPEPPPPPPTAVTGTTPTTVQPRGRVRGEMAARSRGTSSLTIPLSTGGSQPAGPVNLNIGK